MPGREQQTAEHRDQQGAEQHRPADGEGLGQRERLKQPARLVAQRKDGEKADDRRGGGGQQRTGHLLRRPHDRIRNFMIKGRGRHRPVLFPALLLQVHEVLRDVLRHDDAEINHHANGDRDAGQAHDVCPDAESVHDQKGEEHAERQADRDGQAGADVEQEGHHHNDRGEDRLDQRVRDGRRRFLNQLGAVIERGGGQLLARQRRPQIGKAPLHGIDDGLGVLADAHADDRTHMLLIAVRQQSLPELSTKMDLRQVAETDPGPLGPVTPDDNPLHVRDRSDETHPANHGLHSALLDTHRSHIASRLTHGGHQLVQRDSLLFNARGIHIDLILTRHSARRSHLGDSRHTPQRGHHDLVEDVTLRFQVTRSLQGERINLSHRRRIGTEPRHDTGRQDALQLRQSFQHPGAAVVEVAVLRKNHIEITRTVKGHAAHGLYSGKSLELTRQSGCHLGVHVLRALSRPLRPDDDLIVTQIGNGIHRHVTPRPDACDRQRQGRGEGDEGIANDKREHGRSLPQCT